MGNITDTGIRVVILGTGTFERESARVQRQIQQINQAASRAGVGATSFSVSLEKLGSRVQSIGRTLTTSLTLPIIAANAALTKAGIDFEDAFAGISKTVDDVVLGFSDVAPLLYGTASGLTDVQKQTVFADDRFGTLTETGLGFRNMLRDLALEIPLPINELAQLGQVGGQLGVPFGESGEILLNFIKLAAEVGIATDFTAEQGATAFAQFANIMGVEAPELVGWMESVASATVALGNNFATTEPKILEITNRIAGFTKQLGLSEPEILAISATLSSAGVSEEVAGSTITKVFSAMTFAVNDYTNAGKESSATTQQIETDLQQLEFLLSSGMSWEEIKFAMAGSSLVMEGLDGDVNQLGKDFGSLDDIIEKVRNNTEAKLIKALNSGRITTEEYNLAISNMEWQLDDLRFAIQNGITDQDELNRAFASSELVLTGVSGDIQRMNSDVASMGDILNSVRMQSLSKMNEDMSDAQGKMELFAKAMGVTVDEAVRMIKEDPAGAFFKIAAGLAKMAENGELTNDVLNELELNDIRVKNTLFAVGDAQDIYTEALEISNTAALERIALEEEAQKKFKTTKGLLQLLRNAWTDLGITLFDLQKESLDKNIKALTELIKRFRGLDERTQRLILTIGGLSAAAGPVLYILGTLIRQTGKTITTFRILASVVKAQVIPALVSMAVPFAVIAGLVAALYLAFKTNFAGIQDTIDDLIHAFDLAGLIDPLKDFVEAIKSGDIGAAAEAIQTLVRNAINAINSPTFRNTIKNILTTFTGHLWEEVKEAFTISPQDMVNFQRALHQSVYPTIIEVFGPEMGRKIVRALRRGIADTLEALDAIVKPIAPGLNRAFEALKEGDFKKAWIALKKIFVRIWHNLKDTALIRGLSDRVESLYNDVMGEVNRRFKNPEETITKGAQTIGKVIETIFFEAASFIFGQAAVDRFVDKFNGFIEDISPYIPLIIDPLVQGLTDFAEGIVGFIDAFKDVDPTIFAAVGGFFVILASIVTGEILSLLGALLPPIGEGLESIITALSKLVEGDTAGAMNEFSEALNSIIQAIETFDVTLTRETAEASAYLAKALGMDDVDPNKLSAVAEFLITLGEAVGIWIGITKLTTAISALNITTSGATISLSALKTSLLAFGSSVASLALPIILITGALLAFKNNTLGIRDSWDEMVKGIKDGRLQDAVLPAIEVWGKLHLAIPIALAQSLLNIVGWKGDVETNLRDLATVLEGVWGAIKDAISKTWEDIKNLTKDDFINFFKDLPGNIKTAVMMGWNKIKEVGQKIADAVASGFKDIVRKFIDMINDAIPNEIDLGVYKVDISDNPIKYPPGYARGGRMTGPGIVGEKGPELFWPDRAGFVGSNSSLMRALNNLVNPLNTLVAEGQAVSRTSVYSPNIYGVPMRSEEDLGSVLYRSYLMTQ